MTRIVFFGGTPLLSLPCLQALVEDGDIEVAAVVLQPDRPIGRRKELIPTPVKQYARKMDIPVLQPAKLKGNEVFLHALADIDPVVFVIVAYGRIIPQAILDLAPKGSLNVHPSLLPKYRGPSPVNAAIAAGDDETGVSIMLVDDKMDHGPLLAQQTIPLSKTSTTPDILSKSGTIGAPLLLSCLKSYLSGEIIPWEQTHDEATICKMLSREDGRIDWNDAAEFIDQKRRAYMPWPGIFTTISHDGQEKLLKLHAFEISDRKIAPSSIEIIEGELYIGTASLALQISELQPEGKSKMEVEAFLNGYSNFTIVS
jgi:methionyl-tRNA formyltransferase